MTDAPDEAPVAKSPAAALARIPTGAKLFLILSAALLPLALIGLFATLQTTRTADQEARARLRVALAESSRALTIELIGDMTALRAAMSALEGDANNGSICARALGVFAQQYAVGARFAITARDGRLLCGTRLDGGLTTPSPFSPAPLADKDAVAARLVEGRGLVLTIAGSDSGGTATAFFPTGFLASISRPSGFFPAYGAELEDEDSELTLETLSGLGPLDRREEQRVDLGIDDLALEMRVGGAPITSPLIIAMLLPLLMWAAAAGIGWFVVDRLLIRPLRNLRASVAAYRPGEVLDPVSAGPLPAQEIVALGDTFGAITRTVQLHETDLAEGLVRQTRLTREVHHRVKNNLQVISSLINFHARSSRGPEASAAYSSIQRRVDALAVVHRHHFAEMEDNRGLSLRSVIGELASNIRATAPEGSSALGITLEIEPFLVSQDTAVAVAFLLTELVELAMGVNPAAQIRISAHPADTPERAVVRASSPALIETDGLRDLVTTRYGRVMEGLARQLRSRLHHDPLVGAFDISIAVLGRD